MNNPYRGFVDAFSSLIECAKQIPHGEAKVTPKPDIAKDSPRILFFSPHPDDECISGGMALRMFREMKFPVTNVAVTLGSNEDRQMERFEELQYACAYLGYDLELVGERGLSGVNANSRTSDPSIWENKVMEIVEILNRHNPHTIFFPHHEDQNSTHIGVCLLLMDALQKMPDSFTCFVVETEYWSPMKNPNLMVEINNETLADLIAGTSFHKKEISRNPYHVGLPAWTMDNVRRGAEIVGGQGENAPDFNFAALYRLTRYSGGKTDPFFEGGRVVSKDDDIVNAFQD